MFEEDEFSSDEENIDGSGFPSKEECEENYEKAGKEVSVSENGISLREYPHLLTDRVNSALCAVLSEDVRIPFELADFQKLTLHAIGSLNNVVLIAPTGSGKMMIVWLGSLLLRRIYDCPTGVTIRTQPLSIIMEEKLTTSYVPTGVISMKGEMNLNEQNNVRISSPEEDILEEKLPVIIGKQYYSHT